MDTAAPAPDGRLHVLVNNAARFVFGEVTDGSGANWDIALRTNVKGELPQCFWPSGTTVQLHEAGFGRRIARRSP